MSTFECETIVSPIEGGHVVVGDEHDGEEVQRWMADGVSMVHKFQSLSGIQRRNPRS